MRTETQQMRTNSKKKTSVFPLLKVFKLKINLTFWVISCFLEKNMVRISNFLYPDYSSHESFEKKISVNVVNISKWVLLKQLRP